MCVEQTAYLVTMSIVFPNQGRRASAANAVHSRPKLNRSLTVSGESGNGFHASQQPHNEWFPLKKFSKAKQDMSHNFDLLHARLVDSQRFVSQLHTKEMSNCEDDPIKSLIAQTEGNLQLVKRDQMKIAFFGRTSNGKSTVINSLMRAKVLPSGMGHITNCFCSVVGVDESEGYLCTPDSEEKQNVKVSSAIQLFSPLRYKKKKNSSLTSTLTSLYSTPISPLECPSVGSFSAQGTSRSKQHGPDILAEIQVSLSQYLVC